MKKRARSIYKVIAIHGGLPDRVFPANSYNEAHDLRRSLEQSHARPSRVDIIDKRGVKIWPRATRYEMERN